MEYQPGVCNIGKAEQRKRYFGGLAGLFGAILISTGVFLNTLPGYSMVGAFLMWFLAFEGFLQGLLNFCVGFASKGVFDISEEGEEKQEIDDEESRKKDKVRALQIHMYSLTGAITTTSFVVISIVTF